MAPIKYEYQAGRAQLHTLISFTLNPTSSNSYDLFVNVQTEIMSIGIIPPWRKSCHDNLESTLIGRAI
jgi:hypothetical protein